jgi:hypothetical protein
MQEYQQTEQLRKKHILEDIENKKEPKTLGVVLRYLYYIALIVFILIIVLLIKYAFDFRR